MNDKFAWIFLETWEEKEAFGENITLALTVGALSFNLELGQSCPDA